MLGGDAVTDVDLAGSRESRNGDREQAVPGTSTTRLVDVRRTTLVARLAGGIDWEYVGFRLGMAGIGMFDHGTDGLRTNEFTPMPALALRLGPEALHLRGSVADGTWDLRPSSTQVGLGFALARDLDDHEPFLRGFVGFSGDLIDANNGYAAAGLRLRVAEGFAVGGQARAGHEGAAAGMYFGVPF